MKTKRIILAVVTFAAALSGYWVLSRNDRSFRQATPTPVDPSHRFVTAVTSTTNPTVLEGNIPVQPGDRTRVRVYDENSGRLKYQFEAKKWEPVDGSETEFHVEDMDIQMHTPKGQVTYIRADEGNLTLAKNAKRGLDPKRGSIRGHVRLIVDRTTAAWREAHPDLAERDAHPDALIHIRLEDARFDMERAELTSEGEMLVDGSDVRIEKVSGLHVQWNQINNSIDRLRFEHGGRMKLRRGGRTIEFALPGAERQAGADDDGVKMTASDGGAGAPDTAAPRSLPPAAALPHRQLARTMQPMSVSTRLSASEAADEIRGTGTSVAANKPLAIETDNPSPADPPDPMRSPEELAAAVARMTSDLQAGKAGEIKTPDKNLAAPSQAASQPGDPAHRREKIDTYRAVFHNEVVVEQINGLKTMAKLQADTLEVNFDFGKQQRGLSNAMPGQEKSDEPDAAADPAAPKGPLVPKNEPINILADEAPTEPDAVAAADSEASVAIPAPGLNNPDPQVRQDKTKLVLTWNGPLELSPLDVDSAEQTGDRFDAIATGSPVRVDGDQGKAVCLQLVYRHEKKQVWLSGDANNPVELGVQNDRRLTARQVFFDRTEGLARIDGEGSMIDERGGANAGLTLLDEAPPAIPTAAGKLVKPASAVDKAAASPVPDKPRDPVEIHWSRGVDLEIGVRPLTQIDPATGAEVQRRKEFLRRAWFHGNVAIRQGTRNVEGDELAATFGEPGAETALADHISHIEVVGAVRLAGDSDGMSADRLEVQMTTTPEGRNVPRTVDATGKVTARQKSLQFKADQMHAILTATPGDGRLAIENIDASGGVNVTDPETNLKITQADKLKAHIDNGQTLSSALLVGRSAEQPARARYQDVAVHGERIDINGVEQSVNVNGPGKAWMVSRSDFGGRKLKRASVVKTTWQTQMTMQLGKNYGVFLGKVESQSEGMDLKCEKLTIRFARAPTPRDAPKEKDSSFFARLGAIEKDHGAIKTVQDETMVTMERKRPVYIVAEGDAVALSSNYLKSADGNTTGRLLNRMRVGGDQLDVDLTAGHLSVPSAGSMLIEDYGNPSSTPGRLGPSSGLDPLMGSVRDQGPSQTAVLWENGMDFFRDRKLVAFDRNVEMVHRSGQQMVLKEDLAAAMNLTPDNLHLKTGRRTTLSCGNLLIEFLAEDKGDAESPTDALARATDVQRIIAKNSVHLQDGSKSLMGDQLQYLRETNEVVLEGRGSMEARIFEQDESSQRYNMWKGPYLIWNRKTNRIESPEPQFRSSR